MSNLSYQPNQNDENHFENVRAAFARANEAQTPARPRRRPNPEFGRQTPAPVRPQAQPSQKPSISEQYAGFFRQPE